MRSEPMGEKQKNRKKKVFIDIDGVQLSLDERSVGPEPDPKGDMMYIPNPLAYKTSTTIYYYE